MAAALQKFTAEYLFEFYPTPDAVLKDAELAAFVQKVSDPASVFYINGFPKDIVDPKGVSDFVGQVLWITGAQHHALNSFRIYSECGPGGGSGEGES